MTAPLPLTSPRLAVSAASRLSFGLAVVALVGTYVAAQVDFWRRHKPGIAPETYLWPQLLQVWLPGILLTAAFALAGVALHRWRYGTAVLPSSAQAD